MRKFCYLLSFHVVLHKKLAQVVVCKPLSRDHGASGELVIRNWLMFFFLCHREGMTLGPAIHTRCLSGYTLCSVMFENVLGVHSSLLSVQFAIVLTLQCALLPVSCCPTIDSVQPFGSAQSFFSQHYFQLSSLFSQHYFQLVHDLLVSTFRLYYTITWGLFSHFFKEEQGTNSVLAHVFINLVLSHLSDAQTVCFSHKYQNQRRGVSPSRYLFFTQPRILFLPLRPSLFSFYSVFIVLLRYSYSSPATS